MNAQQDPFASVRINRVSQSGQQASKTVQDDPFSQVRVNKQEERPILYETGRHAARIGSRVAETIGGIPGDVSSLLQSGIFTGLEALVGKKISPEAKEKAKEYRAPTSKELKSLSEKATKGFTKAKDQYEEIGDEIASTAASLLGPMKFRRALGVGIGSQAAKEGLKILGTEEGTQEAGKLGTMFLLSMMNPGGAMKYASSQYEKANEIAKGVSVHAGKLESNLKSLLTGLEKGVTTSAKNVVIRPIEDLLPKIKNGKISVDELTAAKRDINTLMGDPALLKRERNLLKGVGREVDQAIGVYEKINPAFKKAYRPANEIYGAVMQGNKASNFVMKTLGAKSVIGAVIAETMLGHPEAILPTAGVAVGALGAAKAGDFMMRVAKSPELQKFYAKAMVAAAAEDAAALRLYEDKIEEIMNSQTHQPSKRTK